jgi:hypothetical protein
MSLYIECTMSNTNTGLHLVPKMRLTTTKSRSHHQRHIATEYGKIKTYLYKSKQQDNNVFGSKFDPPII